MNIKIFTDGSCTNNGKPNAKAGYGVYFPNNEFKNISNPFHLPPITNQRAELYAIYSALSTPNLLKYDTIYIYSDSKYAINCLTSWINKWTLNNWIATNGSPVKNKDIIIKIHDIMKTNKNKIKFIHVNSHKKDDSFETTCNNKVDQLANTGRITPP